MAITISGQNNNDKILASDGVLDSISGFNVVGVMTASTFDVTGNSEVSGKLTANHLNIGSNINFGNAGIITATTFIGNVTGNVNSTSNLLLQISGSEKFRVGNGGQLGIGGANYGTAGQVLTSQGSSSAPTWTTISGTTINNNAANKVIMGSNTANTLEAVAKSTLFGNLNHGQNFLDDQNLIFGNVSDMILIHSSSGSRSRLRNTNDSGSLDLESTLTRFLNKDGSTERLRIDSSGRLLLGTGAVSLPKGTGGGSFDLDGGGITMCVGGNINSTGRTNSTAKINRITSPHYTNAEEPVALVSSYNVSGNNTIYYGGGSSTTNAATQHSFYTAADTTTTIGTERLRINSSGALGVGGANYGSSGQVLTSQGSGSAVTWSTVSGTTINNNADNRLITGSGTANTLEGEANLTYNASSSLLGNLATSSTNNLELVRLENSHSDGKMTFLGFKTAGLGSPQTRIYGGNDNSGAASQAGNSGAGKFKVTITNPSGTHQEVIYAENDANSASKFLRLSTNGNERFRIDSSGRITKPDQPGFGASNMNGWTNLGGSTYAVTSWGTVHHNYGSHFNSSNGRFTVPVDGRYMMHAIGVGIQNSSPHIAFGINNSSNGGGPSRGGTDYGNNNMWSHPTNSGYWVCITHILDLSANDYVRVYTYDWNSSADAPRTYFYGYLLG